MRSAEDEVDSSPDQSEAGRRRTPRVRLVGIRPEYAVLCWQWRNEPRARQFNPFEPLSIEELAGRLGAAGGDLRNQSFRAYRWLVEVDEHGFIGTVSIRANWRMLHGEIGYQIGERWSRRGFGGAAVATLIDTAFADSTLRRLFATISIGNEASRRIVRRLGFIHEGTLRRHHLIEGRYVDQWIYGLLREEWAAAENRTGK